MTAADDIRSEAPRSLALELVIGGKYRVESTLGEGGFARVYRARHVRIRQLEYAIKVLKQRQLNESSAIERFQREAEMSASLQSPYVVRITDFGETSAGLPYIVMEYVNGVTVHDYVQMHGRMRDIEVARVAMCVLRGLEEAHSRGIVHRDLKPSNIMLLHDPSDEDVVAKVTDFGIAKVVDELSELDEGPQTTGGMVFCTPQYAAPEVLMGTPNYQSDLYALGHTLAEMLDGSSPFVGLGAFEVANRQMAPELTNFGDNTRISKLWPVLRKACAKNLEDRYSTASAMLVDVDRVINELKRSELPTARPFARLRKAPGDRAVDPEKLKRDLRADFGLEPNDWRDQTSDVTRRVADSGERPLDPFFQAAQGDSVMESGIAPPVSDNHAPVDHDTTILIEPGLDQEEGHDATLRGATARGASTAQGLPRDLFGSPDDSVRVPFDDDETLPDEDDVSHLFDLATMQPSERPKRQTLTPRNVDPEPPPVAPALSDGTGPGPWAPTQRVPRRTDASPVVPASMPRGAVIAAAIAGAVFAAGATWMLVGPDRDAAEEGPTEIAFSGAIIHDESGDAPVDPGTAPPRTSPPTTDDTTPIAALPTPPTPSEVAAMDDDRWRAIRAARARVFAASTGMVPPAARPRLQWVEKPDEEPLAVDPASRIGDESAPNEPRYAAVPFPVVTPTVEPEPDPTPRPTRTTRTTRPDPDPAPEPTATVVVPIVEPDVDDTPPDGADDTADDADDRDERRGLRIFRPRRLD